MFPSTAPIRRAPWVAIVAVCLLLIAIPLTLFSPIPGARPIAQQAQAGQIGIFCGDEHYLGENMGAGARWDSATGVYPLDHLPRTQWTVQEAYGQHLAFPRYTGEGGRDKMFIIDSDPEASDQDGKDTRMFRGLQTQLQLDEEQTKKLYDAVRPEAERIRSIGNCTVASIVTASSGMLIGVANAMVGFTQSVVNFAFNPNFICPVNGEKPSGCFDIITFLSGTIGGFEGFYAVFVIPMAAFAILQAMYLAFRGDMPRAIRGFVMTVVVTGAGFAFFGKLPDILMFTPRSAQTIAGCVINVIEGRACDDIGGGPVERSPGSAENTSILRACDLEVRGDTVSYGAANGLSAALNSATCRLWVTYVLDPYARANFGVPVTELDTKVPGTIANRRLNGETGSMSSDAATAEQSGVKINPDHYCVPLGGGIESLQTMRNRPLGLNQSRQVCNVAAYQLYLMTETTQSIRTVTIVDIPYGDVTATPKMRDDRWYRIIGFNALDPVFWGAWRPSSSVSFSQMQTGFGAILTAALGLWVILFMAILGMVYFLQLFIIPIWGPFVFIFGVIENYRSSLYQWALNIIEAGGSYIASILFITILIKLYEGIMVASTSTGMTFLLLVAISIAMFIYRHSFLGLFKIGDKFNFGAGDKISQANQTVEGSTEKWMTTLRPDRATATGFATGVAVSRFVANRRRDKQMANAINQANETWVQSANGKDSQANQLSLSEQAFATHRSDQPGEPSYTEDNGTEPLSSEPHEGQAASPDGTHPPVLVPGDGSTQSHSPSSPLAAGGGTGGQTDGQAGQSSATDLSKITGTQVSGQTGGVTQPAQTGQPQPGPSAGTTKQTHQDTQENTNVSKVNHTGTVKQAEQVDMIERRREQRQMSAERRATRAAVAESLIDAKAGEQAKSEARAVSGQPAGKGTTPAQPGRPSSPHMGTPGNQPPSTQPVIETGAQTGTPARRKRTPRVPKTTQTFPRSPKRSEPTPSAQPNPENQ